MAPSPHPRLDVPWILLEILFQQLRLSLIKMPSRAPGSADAASAGIFLGNCSFQQGAPPAPMGVPIPPVPGSCRVHGKELLLQARVPQCHFCHSSALWEQFTVRTKKTEGRELPTVPRVAILFLMGHVKPICSSKLHFLTIFLRPRLRCNCFLPQSLCLLHTCTLPICRAPLSLLPHDSGASVLLGLDYKTKVLKKTKTKREKPHTSEKKSFSAALFCAGFGINRRQMESPSPPLTCRR